MSKIKVLIADDSGFVQLLMKNILSKDSEIDVIAIASNGKEAFELTEEKKPDVVLMDVLMPDYDGLFGIRNIMKFRPTPIIVLSTVGNKSIGPIIEALKLGAIDYLNKPNGNSGLRTMNNSITKLIKQVARLEVEKMAAYSKERNQDIHNFSTNRMYDLIIVGSSTGGPQALSVMLNRIPANMEVPILIVQHMPKHFILSFVERLNATLPHTVELASHETVIQNRKIYVADGQTNLKVVRNSRSGNACLQKTTHQYKEYNNPSINSIMESAAEVYGPRLIGVILTGMGQDGTIGATAIKKHGGYTVAQNKESSVVYGMPKEAIERGVINRVVGIDEIGEFLISCIS